MRYEVTVEFNDETGVTRSFKSEAAARKYASKMRKRKDVLIVGINREQD